MRASPGPGPRAGSSGARRGSLGVSRLDGKEDEIRRFLELGVSKTAIAKIDHRRFPDRPLQLHEHPRPPADALALSVYFRTDLVGTLLKNLDDLKQIGFAANGRLLGVERLSHDATIGAETLASLHRPAHIDGQRASALRFGDPRVQALLAALLRFDLFAGGIPQPRAPRGGRPAARDCRSTTTTLAR